MERLCALALVLAGASQAAAAADTASVSFARDVRPVLSKCLPCHGPDDQTREAGLRLDLRDDAVRERKGRTATLRAIAPGAPEKSEAMRRVLSDDPAEKMPPPKAGRPLSPQEIATLNHWIAEGAPYTGHWAFAPVVRPAPPPVRHAEGATGAIDAFVLARLENTSLAPSPTADRWTLARRVALDLTGLPLSLEETETFAEDPTPDAYTRLVDRLLASPRYGERWARVWLDLARYADSAGYGSDPLRMNIWPWRDWVINAYNENMPYDRFTLDQMAGDLLPNATQAQIIATALHRNTMTNTEGGTDDEEFRVAAVKDRIGTTVQTWMGLTMGCAQCHTHKYDPITQAEYYSFYALFNQTEDNDRPDEEPKLPFPTAAEETEAARLDAEIKAMEAGLGTAPTDALKEALKKKKAERAAVKPVAVPILRERPADKRRTTRILVKGNFLSPGDEVQPGTPAAFHPLPDGAPKDRLGVARWLTSTANPLTARVAVNRLWAQLFGIGLVETEEDFGTQGQPPSHPELLDWLAAEFMEAGWDQKALLRTIVLSRTYQQSAKASTEGLEKDPRNRLLSRASRRRLDAEAVRDQALALSGLLSPKIGGPSVYPPQPDGLWRAAFNGERTWATSKGEDRYRRGLYTFWRRTVPYPSMATFDAPSRENCTLRRMPTNTPLQAFVTLNDPAYVEMAQALARRVIREGGGTPAERARWALRLALGRPLHEREETALPSLFERARDELSQKPEDAAKLAGDTLGVLPVGSPPAEIAAWTVVANVILNLDGVLTRS